MECGVSRAHICASKANIALYMCFSSYCDVIVVMVVVCILVLMSNQHLIVLGINKDIALSSSLRHDKLNIYSLFKELGGRV